MGGFVFSFADEPARHFAGRQAVAARSLIAIPRDSVELLAAVKTPLDAERSLEEAGEQPGKCPDVTRHGAHARGEVMDVRGNPVHARVGFLQ